MGDRYRLSQRIAGGAMGDVWSANDQLLKRPVAVKVPNRQYGEDLLFRERFRLEAQAAAGLSHPGIASVFDFGEEIRPDGEHVAYIVMELVDGESLNQLLAREGSLDAVRTLRIVSEVGDALQAAHAKGIVHRDIKPANVLIGTDELIKITDFGIARAADAGALTQTGAMVGTVQYMAPEQLRGQRATGAADIYALGVVAYVCLSGQPPFPRAEPITVAMAHINDVVPALPPSVPKPVRDLVMQMLAKDPQQRPASGHDVSTRAASIAASMPRPMRGLTRTRPPAGSGPETETVVTGIDGEIVGGTEPLELHPTKSFTAVMPGPKPFAGASANDRRSALRLTRRAVVLACVVVLAVVALSVALLAGGSSSVPVPNVTGSAASVATARLKGAGFLVSLRQTDIDQKAGTVVAQSPRPGVTVQSGDRVILSVSDGKVMVDALALEGQPYATVAARLTALGLVPREVAKTSSATPGNVIAVAPSGQAAIGTPVTVTVAIAPVPTTVAPPAGGPGGHVPTTVAPPAGGPGGHGPTTVAPPAGGPGGHGHGKGHKS